MSDPRFDGLRVLITGACGVTSRTLVRALRLSPLFSGAHFVGCDVCDNPYGLYEGLYERIYRVPSSQDKNAYGEVIRKIIKTERIAAALVVPELEVLAWTLDSFGVPCLLPPPNMAQIAISKQRLHEALSQTPFLPSHRVFERNALLAGNEKDRLQSIGYPLWLRDVGEGSTSGKGSVLVQDHDQVRAWCELNRTSRQLMAAQYLPGRNLACLMLFDGGRVVKRASYERLTYFMSKVSISGVTGNISEGRLIHDARAEAIAEEAVLMLAQQTGETMQGLVTVDMRCDAHDQPRITEINLRQVAAASAFAHEAGANLAEAHLLLTIGRPDLVDSRSPAFPPNNRLFRDIDGNPVYVPDYRPLAVGQWMDAP